MSNDHKRKLAEFVEDLATPEVPWESAANAFVAMKKRAMIEPTVETTKVSAQAYNLLAHMVSEKLALQAEAQRCGFSKMAATEGAHARYFMRCLGSTEWILPEVPQGTKLAAMIDRSIQVMHHLSNELGDDPVHFTVDQFIRDDGDLLGKLANLEVAQQEKTASAAELAGALVRIKQKVKKAGKTKKAQHSAISGGALRGPDPTTSRPRHEVRDAGQYTYHGDKDDDQPKESKKASLESNQARVVGVLGKTAAKLDPKRVKDIVKMVRGKVQPVRGSRKVMSKAQTEHSLGALDSSWHGRYPHKTLSKIKKSAALKVVKLMKLAAEAGMSVEDYVGAEDQANQQMEKNELEHVRGIAEKATQENTALAERASQAEQQLQQVQQQLVGAQQQGQMSMQQASDSEANAAEQANSKLRMKMKIDQMRQTLADLAAVNPQMDEAPGPEAGMPQPGAPAGPVQQQAEAAQQAAQQPQTAGAQKETQEAQKAQQNAATQTQQAQQKQQQQQGAAPAGMPGMPGMPAVPSAAPAPPTVPVR